MSNKKAEGKFALDIEIIFGLVILAIGTAILIEHYKILPIKIPIPKETMYISAGFVCLASGLILTLKKLTKRSSF